MEVSVVQEVSVIHGNHSIDDFKIPVESTIDDCDKTACGSTTSKLEEDSSQNQPHQQLDPTTNGNVCIVKNPPANNVVCHLRSALKKPDLTNNTATTSGSTEGRSVTFDKIHVRVYKIEIGDNPASTIGPPIQLSWDAEEEMMHDVNTFEQERHGRRRTNPRHFVLNYHQRMHMLKGAGHSEADIPQASNDVAKVRRERNATIMLLPVSKVEEAVRSAGRKVKRAVRRRHR